MRVLVALVCDIEVAAAAAAHETITSSPTHSSLLGNDHQQFLSSLSSRRLARLPNSSKHFKLCPRALSVLECLSPQH